MKQKIESIRKEIRFYRMALKLDQVPLLAKLCIVLALGYMFMPIDLIPDFIPGLGFLDDIIVVGSLIAIAKKLISAEVIEKIKSSFK